MATVSDTEVGYSNREFESVRNDYEYETSEENNNTTKTDKSPKRDPKTLVDNLIAKCRDTCSSFLDLNRRSLKKIPDGMLELSHLEYLYLEGNELVCLPENFFDCFPKLIWLDLRNNHLVALPSAYIGRHQHLKTLLVQGNELRSLPLELGLVTTINGLNLCNNPIEFPPKEVLERGYATVLAFLRETLKSKMAGRFPAESQDYSCEVIHGEAMPNLEDLHIEDSDNSSEDNWGPGRFSSKLSRQSSKYSRKSSLKDVFSRTHSRELDLTGPVLQSASLQRRASYDKIKKDNQFHKAPSRKKLAKLSQYPEPPPPERVQETYLAEKRLARLRELKEKQEMILQRRRDQDALKEWQDDGRKKQIKKQREKYIKGKIDYEEPAKQAPYGVDQEHMHMMTNEERIAHDVREKHENIRNRLLSPKTIQRLERDRMERDRELEKRLKEHTNAMQERRRQPKGTPQQEMAAAKRELEVAEKLQKELEQRRKALEYRFTAFTGEIN